MNLTIKHIALWLKVNGEILQPEKKVKDLLLDSRKYYSGEGYLFFALRGENHDGHNFIESLYEKGVRDFVVEEIPNPSLKGANFLLVDDSLVALQSISRQVREMSNAKVIGITGSNGKTIVKEWLSQIVGSTFKVHKTPKSFNSQVGVPLAVWGIKETDEFGIFEAGISQPGEMAALEKILKPSLGIFTNIGSAHEQFFNNRREKIEEKLKLFKNCEKLIYCLDHEEINSVIGEKQNLVGKILTWSFETSSCDFYVKEKKSTQRDTKLKAVYQDKEWEINIPFTDDASVENAIHVWLSAIYLGLDAIKIKEGFNALEQVAMRLEMKTGLRGSILINDTYNSDLESLNIAIDFLKQQAQNREKLVILSDIHQAGLEKEDLYQKLASLLKDQNIDKWIAVGDELKNCAQLFSSQVDFYSTTQELIEALSKYNLEGKAILLKGARSFQFEDISKILEQKSHETVLEIHLDRMVSNLNYYRSQLKEEVKVMAMVKAFSYGSGSYEIASLLQFHKVDYLAVAYTDEGVDLRKAGIDLPIMVLNAEPSSFDDIINYQLEPEIYSFRMLELFSKKVQENGLSDFPIHIKLDTGMHRLGFANEEMQSLGKQLQKMDHLAPVSMFSHLASSDNSKHESFTQGQIKLFMHMSTKLEEFLERKILRHIVNSAGITSFPNAHFDMVRLGIGLYGVSSNDHEQKMLNEVSELKASVSQVKEVKKGEFIGYGLSHQANEDMTIATITLGYADGLRRALSNGKGKVWIKGNFYPIVGRVCMDMTMIDVSGADVKEGDRVEIMGSHQSVYELAEKMDTIPYEVLTGISSRVKRVYYLE